MVLERGTPLPPGVRNQEKYKLSGSKRNGEERQLFRAYLEEGDLGARERLVERFLPLARQLARRYGAAGSQWTIWSRSRASGS